MKQGKVWGTTVKMFEIPGVITIHSLEIKAGGFCSEHVHKTRKNIFYVIAGKLAVQIWRSDFSVDRTVLNAGEITEVDCGVYHDFEALEDTLALEIYTGDVGETDIVRRTMGGKR
jgi:mannose-6-phosphate isomerase-like protein (cupin superfamily)